MGEGGLDQVEIGKYIGLKHAGELARRDVENAPLDVLHGVVVDQNVQPAEPLDGLGHAAFRRAWILQVPAEQQTLDAQLPDPRLRLRRVGLLVVVGDGHIRPLFGKGVGHRPADTAVPAGDQCGAALQLPADGAHSDTGLGSITYSSPG